MPKRNLWREQNLRDKITENTIAHGKEIRKYEKKTYIQTHKDNQQYL